MVQSDMEERGGDVGWRSRRKGVVVRTDFGGAVYTMNYYQCQNLSTNSDSYSLYEDFYWAK